MAGVGTPLFAEKDIHLGGDIEGSVLQILCNMRGF